MNTLEQIKNRVNETWRQLQLARDNSERAKLQRMYAEAYRTYKLQKLILGVN